MSTAGTDKTGEAQPYLDRHAGIREREGAIPLWLKLVVVGLLCWSPYYTSDTGARRNLL